MCYSRSMKAYSQLSDNEYRVRYLKQHPETGNAAVKRITD
jgi:hypothetical protein